MTDPIAPAAPCLVAEVLSVDEMAGTAEVRFLNPAHAGGPLTPVDRQVPNPAFGIEEDAEATLTITDLVDQDPNPHVVKQVNVPLTETGAIDDAVWRERLIDQAFGAKARMSAGAVPTEPVSLASLIGPVT